MLSRNTHHVVTLVVFCFLAVASAFTESRVVAIDNISPNALARFNRTAAVVDERLRITSIENNAVIPKNHRYPIVEWESPEDCSTAFLVELKSGKRTLEVLLRRGSRWQPDSDEFAKLLSDGEMMITIYRLNRGLTSKSRPVRLVVSERTLTDRVVYRVVPLYFNPGEPVAIKLLSLEQRQPELLLKVQRACVGCHAYASVAAVFNCVQKRPAKLSPSNKATAATASASMTSRSSLSSRFPLTVNMRRW